MNTIREILTKMFETLFVLAVVLGLLVLVGWLLVKIWIGILAGISFVEIMMRYR